MINIQKAGQNIITLSIEDREKSTNFVNDRFIMHFETLVEEITRDESTRGIIITSAKNDFLLEQDLGYFSELETPHLKRDYLLRLQKSMNMLEGWGKPVVAALSGSAIGAGLEISLACHHRIAIDHSTIKFGLSSHKLGLMPCLGGIQRLSRLLGIEQTERIIRGHKTYSPQQAWEIGVVNGLADTNAQMMEMAFAWIEQHPTSQQPWVNRVAKDPLDPSSTRGREFFRKCSQSTYTKNFTNALALRKTYERLHDGFLVNFERACKEDSIAMVELFSNKDSKNLIDAIYFGTKDCKRWADLKSKDASPTKALGIYTNSEDSNGLILSIIASGVQVLLKNKDRTSAEAQKNTIAKQLDQFVKEAYISKETRDFQLSLLEVSEDLEEFRSCDFIIDDFSNEQRSLEQIVEQTKELLGFKKSQAILATTLRNCSLEELTLGIDEAQEVIGLNFNSVSFKEESVIELMKGPKTSGKSIKGCLRLFSEVGKVSTVMNESPNFFSKSLLDALQFEILLLLKEGYSLNIINRSAVSCGLTTSPIELIQNLNIDILKNSLNQKQKKSDLDSHELLEIEEVLTFLNSVESIEQLLLSKTSIKNINQKLIPDRLLLSVLSTAVEFVEQKRIHAPIEADLISIQRVGFPAHTGGVLSYVQYLGTEAIEKKYNQLNEMLGDRFLLPKLLKSLSSKSTYSIYQLENYFYQNRIEQEEQL